MLDAGYGMLDKEGRRSIRADAVLLLSSIRYAVTRITGLISIKPA
jgi:hypothetical protein